MKNYTSKINQIISQIDEVHREVIAQKPFYDDENHEEALDELTSAAAALEDLCGIFERDEAYQDAKNQMNLNL
jgi:hypothetical protein